MQEFKISVVIPVYNRDQYLSETLDSVLQQSYKPAEIVVVDDGSTDNSWEIIQGYGDRLVTIQIKNSGAGNARRIGVENSSCPWVAFCDSDDIWLPFHLERRVKLLSRYTETNYSFSDMVPFGPNARSTQTFFAEAPKVWWARFGEKDENNFMQLLTTPYRNFLEFNPIATPTVLMTRNLYDEIGGINPKYSRMPAEDSDLNRRAIAAGNVCCDFTVTAKQRRHEQNMSAVEVENLLGKVQILEDHVADHAIPDEEIEFAKQAARETLNEAILASFYKRDYELIRPARKKIAISKLPLPIAIRYVYLRILSLFRRTPVQI